MLYEYTLSITTEADETFTGYLGTKISGKIVAIFFDRGDLADGAWTFTGETTGLPIFYDASMGAVDRWIFPKIAVDQAKDGDAATDAFTDVWVYRERIKVVATSAGNAKTGTITVWVDEPQ